MGESPSVKNSEKIHTCVFFDAEQCLNGPLGSILHCARDTARQSAYGRCIDQNSPSVKNSEKNRTYVFFDAEQLLNGLQGCISSYARDTARQCALRRCFKPPFQ